MPFTLSGMGLKTYEDSPLLRVLGRRAGATDKVLVIIQLNGGNDGLNTLIPTDQYRISTPKSLRPSIGYGLR